MVPWAMLKETTNLITMKITITLFLASVLLFSCDKDNPTPTSSSNPTSSSDTIVYSSYGNLYTGGTYSVENGVNVYYSQLIATLHDTNIYNHYTIKEFPVLEIADDMTQDTVRVTLFNYGLNNVLCDIVENLGTRRLTYSDADITFSCTIYPTKTVSVNYDRKNQTGSWEKQYFDGVFMK